MGEKPIIVIIVEIDYKMKNIQFAHDWFSFEHNGNKYTSSYLNDTTNISPDGLLRPPSSELGWLAIASAEEIIRKYDLKW